jgi:hypothetical protein
MEKLDEHISDFTNYLLGKLRINFENYYISLKEENLEISSNPFISCLLGFYLKNKVNVILVASQENLIHYSTINKKFVRRKKIKQNNFLIL